MSKRKDKKPLEFWVFTPEFTKSEKDGRRLIRGYASVSDILDRQNEVITHAALEVAKNDLLENTTVFYEHKHSDFPIGKVVDAGIDDNGLFVEVELSSTADKIWTLIQEDILQSFSIGGKVLASHETKDKKTGNPYTEITKLELFEVSIVGLPANQAARFELVNKSFSVAITEEMRKRREGENVEKEIKKVTEKETIEKDSSSSKLTKKEQPKEEIKKETIVEEKKEEVVEEKISESEGKEEKKEEETAEKTSEEVVEETKEEEKKEEVKEEKKEEEKAEEKIAAKCPHCNKEFDYLAKPENKMGSVSCPECGKDVTPKDEVKEVVEEEASVDVVEEKKEESVEEKKSDKSEKPVEETKIKKTEESEKAPEEKKEEVAEEKKEEIIAENKEDMIIKLLQQVVEGLNSLAPKAEAPKEEVVEEEKKEEETAEKKVETQEKEEKAPVEKKTEKVEDKKKETAEEAIERKSLKIVPSPYDRLEAEKKEKPKKTNSQGWAKHILRD